MIDYKLLEALAAVVHEGGFERAASVLYISQSAVSQRIKLLEEQFGSILLTRKNPPELTESGVRLLKHFRQVKMLEDGLYSETEGHADHFRTLRIGINGDSLSTWFIPVISRHCIDNHILLDIMVDDQEVTHRLLKEGHVSGCISGYSKKLPGCRVEYLGFMDYYLMAGNEFVKRWFPDGYTFEAAELAPVLIFNRKDNLQHQMMEKVFGRVPKNLKQHYIPSPEPFNSAIEHGLGYGMIPEQFFKDSVQAGHVVKLHPEPMRVELFWHSWDIDSAILNRFTKAVLNVRETLS